MAKPIRAAGFRGMSNHPVTPARLLDDARLITPQIILNADVAGDGVLLPRVGRRRLAAVSNCHSLWSGTEALFIAQSANGGPALHKLAGDTPVEVAMVSGPSKAPMSYAEVNNIVYLSNGYWKGAYDLLTGTVRSWGLPLPPPPKTSLVDGDLPPGRYSLCYTTYENGRIGGNGSIVTVEFWGDSFGIKLINPPANVLCWITQPNGGDFYLAQVDGDNVIRSPYYTQRLPTLHVIPPPLFTCMFAGAGRLWGASGKTLYYSHEFRYEDFSPANTIPFTEEIVLLAPIADGIFVNSRRSTWLIKGYDPAKMSVDHVGEGAVPGTLTYALVEGGGYEISRKLSQLPSPVWMSPAGVVVGTANGHLVHMTESRLRLWPMSRGAAAHWMQDGRPLTLVTLYGAPTGQEDQDLRNIFERGKIFISAPLLHGAQGGVNLSGEGALS